MRSLSILLLASGLLITALPAAAQGPAVPRSARSVQHLVVMQAHALTGRNPDTRPGPEQYRMVGFTAAYRNRWRETDADYDTDLTIGVRFGTGRAVRTGYFPNNRSVDLPLTGGNVFVAADGRFVGGTLGVWLGKLGSYRGGEAQRVARFAPQVRLRAGRSDGWHAQLDYADEFQGFANPPLRLGGGLRFPQSPLTLLVGAAIPTLTAEGSEVQAFAKIGLRIGQTFEASAYLQPRFSTAAPDQFAFTLGYVP